MTLIKVLMSAGMGRKLIDKKKIEKKLGRVQCQLHLTAGQFKPILEETLTAF